MPAHPDLSGHTGVKLSVFVPLWQIKELTMNTINKNIVRKISWQEAEEEELKEMAAKSPEERIKEVIEQKEFVNKFFGERIAYFEKFKTRKYIEKMKK